MKSFRSFLTETKYAPLHVSAVVAALRKGKLSGAQYKTYRFSKLVKTGFQCKQFNPYTVYVTSELDIINGVTGDRVTTDDYMALSKQYEAILTAAGFDCFRKDGADPTFVFVRKPVQ